MLVLNSRSFKPLTLTFATYHRGRNWNVEVGQVGLRCKHCYNTPEGDKNHSKSSRYFPLTLSAIYQAAQNIYHFHFKNGCCPCMPQQTLANFDVTKSNRSYYGGGKQYWVHSAEAIGLIETTSGLRFKSSLESRKSNKDTNSGELDTKHLENLLRDATRGKKCLVKPEDRHLVTDYIFLVMCQMVHFPARDGYSGDSSGNSGLVLCCKHCMGDNGNGIFNRTKVASISKNEYFAQVHRHLEKCSNCPSQLKDTLSYLKELHNVQKRKLKRGNKKEFFISILDRLT